MSEKKKRSRDWDDMASHGSCSSNSTAKNKSDLTEDELKKRRARVALASRQSRAKKKKEFETLKEANQKLHEEREHFLAKINQLESQVENQISSTTADMIAENSALTMEIDMHKKFIESFMALAAIPSSLIGQRKLCMEAAEAAQAYFQGMVAESQTTDWKRLEMPSYMHVPTKDFCLHYTFQENFFGADAEKRMKRFNLRLDMSFPGVPAEKVSNYYWDLYNDSEEQHALLGLKAVALKQIDMPDENTRLQYHRKTWNDPKCEPTDVSYSDKDQDAVFILNRVTNDMPRSSLRPPHISPGALDETETEIYVGKAKVITVAMTSTRSIHETMKTYDNAKEELSEQNVQHITSVIAQGAMAWTLNDTTRFTCIISYPEEFRWLDFSFADCVTPDGKIGDQFAMLLVAIATRLHNIFYPPQSSSC